LEHFYGASYTAGLQQGFGKVAHVDGIAGAAARPMMGVHGIAKGLDIVVCRLGTIEGLRVF
jgi:hypothetical protein